MFKQALACVQSRQSLHCSRTCAKWAYIPHILSVNAQTSLIVCAVLLEPSLLSHVHKMDVHMTYFSVNAQTRLSMHSILPEHSLLSHIHKMGVFMVFLSVNAQTSLSMRAVSPEPSLLSHMHKMGVHLVYPSIQCSDAHEHVCSLARAFTALTHACTKWAYIGHILSVNAQTRLSMCTVSSEPLRLAH